MSDSAEAVKVEITASVKGLLDGFSSATSIVKASTGEMRDQLASLIPASDTARESFGRLASGAAFAGGSARGAAGGLGEFGAAAAEAGSFSEELTHHIRGMRQEMFLGSFMARQIGELGIASKSTAGMVAGLAGAFLVGNWTGLAVEGVLKLIGAFNEMGVESEKAVVEAIKSIGELHDKVEDYIASLHKETEVEKLRRKDLAPLEEKEAAQKANLVALTDALAVAMAKLRTASGSEVMSMKGGVELAKQRVEEAQKLLDLTQTQVNAAKQELKKADTETNDADKDAEAEKSLQEQEKFQDTWNQYRQQSYETDLDNWKKHLEDVKQAKLKDLIEEAESAKREATEESAIRKAVLDGEQAHRDKLKAQEDAADKKRMERVKHVADQIAASATSVLRSVVDGTASVGDAIKNLFEDIAFEVIGALLKMAAEQVAAALFGAGVSKAASLSATEGHIAEAASGAYASQAFIPFVGPELGAAAALQATTMLQGLTAPMLSAEHGFDIPAGVNPIVQTHEREMILPEEHADTIRNLKDGGHVSVTFNAPVDRDWWRANEANILDTIRRAARRGRVP